MISIEFMEGCNFRCYFCSAQHVEKNIYMDLGLFKHIILQAKELGIDRVSLTPCRGEPFLHPDVYEILDFANSHMKHVHMITNATAINVQRIKEVNLSNTSLGVSYYGQTPERFKELTRTNNHLFNTFHKRLAELTEANIPHSLQKRCKL